jgi:ABC-type polysaccharide/polyol phosphate transport system ATPase subunit
VSHSPQIVSEFCDRVLLIEEGRIRSEGRPAEVIDQYLELLTP